MTKTELLALAQRLSERRMRCWIHATGEMPKADGYIDDADCTAAAAVLREYAGTLGQEPIAPVAVSKFSPACKIGGSYQADGYIVSRFTTTAGAERVVFEFNEPKGMLHIFTPEQIEEKS